MNALTPNMADALHVMERALPGDVGCDHHATTTAVNGVTARTLLRRGLVDQTSIRPSRYTLNHNGVLLILAGLADWTTPADIGDGFVIDLCARCAVRRGLDSVCMDDALARVNTLLAAIGTKALTFEDLRLDELPVGAA